MRARGVETLTLFGSIARGDATSASDVDLAVRPGVGFSAGGFDHFGRLDALRDRLSALLGCDVDLVEETAARASAAGDRTGRCACVLADGPRASWIFLDNIRLIQSYLQGMDRAAFEADSRTRDAVERCLERLSEAATKRGSQADELAPGLLWPAVRAFGNVLLHAYDQVGSCNASAMSKGAFGASRLWRWRASCWRSRARDSRILAI